ncbi:MAG: hypothetical protein U9N85_09475 [Bacteroidota bacterium]|nr:hypothetical protein [Bacteroidota bacterium]
MAFQDLKNEDKVFIRTVFKEMRKNVQGYVSERAFSMSNAQLFTFLSNAPAALAVSSDGTVDNAEIAALEQLSKAIDVNQSVNMELQEMVSVAGEPDDCMINEEFNLRVGSELLYLSRNFSTYETEFIEAIKALLTFDFSPENDGSLTAAFRKLMDDVVENNFSKDKEAEQKKVDELKQKLGI